MLSYLRIILSFPVDSVLLLNLLFIYYFLLIMNTLIIYYILYLDEVYKRRYFRRRDHETEKTIEPALDGILCNRHQIEKTAGGRSLPFGIPLCNVHIEVRAVKL